MSFCVKISILIEILLAGSNDIPRFWIPCWMHRNKFIIVIKFYVFIFSWLDVSVGATQYFELKDDDDEPSQLPRWLQFFVGTAGDRRIIHAEWWILSMSSWFRYVGFIRGVSISNIHYLEVISLLDVLGMQRMKSSRTTVEYIPSAPPLFQFGDWRKMDPEVGKAHHMRVA